MWIKSFEMEGVLHYSDFLFLLPGHTLDATYNEPSSFSTFQACLDVSLSRTRMCQLLSLMVNLDLFMPYLL